jgi:hypothetical protein
MENNYINRKEFAAKVEQRLKQNQSTASGNADSFDYESFIERFKASKADTVPVPNAPATAGAEPVVSSLLKKAEELAAVSGKFDPNSLFDKEVTEEDRYMVLNSLSPDCVVETVTTIQWLLQQKRRSAVLKRLIDNNELKPLLEQVLPPTDIFGDMLRRTLKEGEAIPLHELGQDQLLGLINVLETTYDINFSKPVMTDVKALLANPLLADYNILAKDFIGRDPELRRLFDFLHDNKQVGTFPNDWTGIVVKGVGGVGKSTLLAKFTQEILSKKLASVVVLDFDRPGIVPTDTAWLELEMTKQIANQYGNERQRLTKARQDIRKQEADYGLESVSESLRSSRGLIWQLVDVLHNAGATDKPFLIILDTVEEVKKHSLLDLLKNWISDMCGLFYPITVKVVFSGRLYEDQLVELLTTPQIDNTPLDIVAFDKTIAVQFLVKKQGLDEERAKKVAESEVLPLRPLELKLIARLLLKGTATIEDLEKDLKEGTNKESLSELFAGIIYQRVLKRLNDPLLSALAYPGLVLRYVTTPLILHVLQPALGLPEMTETEADKVRDDLAGYTWLAFRDSLDRVWHSKDLRRSMLRLMIAQEPEKVLNIRRRAIKWFEEQGTEEYKAESIYHQLMMVNNSQDGKSLELKDLNIAYHYIEADIADLSRPAAILLQFAANKKLDEADISFLPDRYFLRAYESVGRSLVSTRQFNKALLLFQKAQQLEFSLQSNGLGILDKWEKELLYSVGLWAAIKKLPTYQSIDPRRPSLSNTINYLFPAGIIDPADVDRHVLKKLLSKGLENENLSRTLSGPENITILNRLAYCLGNLHAIEEIEDELKQVLMQITQVMYYSERTPSLEKSLIILNTICSGRPPDEYKLGFSLVKLDTEWINRLAAFTPIEFHDLIKYTADYINRTDLTCTRLLSELDGDHGRKEIWRKTTVNLHGLEKEVVYNIIKGPDRLFRDPCRYAALEAMETDDDRRKMAGIIQSVIKVKLTDLQPEVFAATIAQHGEISLEPYIEIIDRCWAFGDFLRIASKEFPASYKLKTVLEAYERWDSAYQRLLLSKPLTQQKPEVHNTTTIEEKNKKSATMGTSKKKKENVAIAEKYRRTLVGTKTSGLESAAPAEADLSDDAIKDRTETSRSELYRIIDQFLDKDPSLYKIVNDISKNGADALKAVANGDDKYLSKNPKKTSYLEVIVRTDGSRPSFMIQNGKVNTQTSPVGTWSDILVVSQDHLEDAIACVGRINLNSIHIGTGFMIHENLIVTNRHVLQDIAVEDSPGKWLMEPGANIDFGHEFRARLSVNRRSLKEVIFAGPTAIDPEKVDHAKLDLVIIRMDAVEEENLPKRILSLNIAPDWAEENKIIFTIGYPGDPGPKGLQNYSTLLEQLFKSTYGCKRLAPGMVVSSVNNKTTWGSAHDATTLGGNSGSVVLVTGREYAAAGLHYGGTLRAPRENWAHILGNTLQTKDAAGKSLKEWLDQYEVKMIDTI